jgi:hypothetical protein
MSTRLMNSQKLLTLLLGTAFVAACNGDDTTAALDGTGTTGGPATGSGDTDASATTTTTTTTPTTSADETSTGADPTCDDGIHNGDETDVDCGGPTCSACQPGRSCEEGSDCTSEVCEAGLCAEPSCSDGVLNGDETDVDCGGSCGPCGTNQSCRGNEDCASNICDGGVCIAASCSDGVLNGNETDVDCGGSCPACPEGGACQENGDCTTAFCHENTCLAVECVTNAHCSHLAGTCIVGQCNQATNECQAVPAFQGAPCNDGDSCTNSTCNNGMCGGPQINCSHLNAECAVGVCEEGVGCVVQALNDTDPCEDGNFCTTGTTCSGGSCIGGEAVDCSHLDSGCTIGVCNQFNGTCNAQLSPGGTPCDDAAPCGTTGTCDATGACISDDMVALWSEDFANNDAGWTLGPEWQVGPASGSACPILGQDPAQDHTQAGDNGVAGVVIGGCASTMLHDFYCLTSPVIDATTSGPLLFEFWRHLHSDYTPFMQNRVDVFDGNGWVNLWLSGSSPAIDDPAWMRIIHEVSDYKNSDFQMRFCFNIDSGGVWTVASWNIDDVALLTCP